MIALYLAALVVAIGALVGQLAFGHHDADASGMLSVDSSTDAHAPEGAQGELAVLGTTIASVRFWAFALLAFGMVGSALTLFDLAGATVTMMLAAISGVAAGTFAVTVVRQMVMRATSSHATASEFVGKLGRVIVPLVPGGRGKVRVQVRGTYVDFLPATNTRRWTQANRLS